MNKIACIYFEGNDSKIALFEKENNAIKILKADSIDSSLAFEEKSTSAKSNGSDKTKTSGTINYIDYEDTAFQRTFYQKLQGFFIGEDISKIKFIPILAEPAVYYQKISDDKDLASINIDHKGKIESTIDFIKMYDNSKLAVYPSGKSNYLEAIYTLAKINNKKYLKIPAVKSAEISLLSFIANKNDLKAEDISLVIYIGKEYSRMAFLLGKEIYQLGSNLAVGKNSFNAHNVLISKILLEMENSHIGNVNNIIICGEDTSEELISLAAQAYPSSKVYFQKLDNSSVKELDKIIDLPSFIVPIVVAEEYFHDEGKKSAGINLLPESVKEDQKILKIQWHGYLLILLSILSMGYFGSKINSNNKLISQKQTEIQKMQVLESRNRETVNKIESYENKIRYASQTESVLQRLSSGREYISTELKKISDFVDTRKNFWINHVVLDEGGKFQIEGYTLHRPSVKALADTYNNVLLQNVIYDPLREIRTFKFKIDAGAIKEGAGK